MTTTPDVHEIKRTLNLLAQPSQVVELRALEVSEPNYRAPHIVSGYFDNWEKLAEATKQIAPHAKGVYLTPNPINPALIARANNRARAINGKDTTTADSDIVSRRWLLIDADPVRPSGISASDNEHAAAIERIKSIREFLSSRYWTAPIVADSGNGGHLLYHVDLPANDDGLVERVLKTLAFWFDDESVTIDQKVFNPARIWKLYGTMARKGDNTPDRPHRLARILEAPAPFSPVSRELLKALTAELPQETVRALQSQAQYNGMSFDIDTWIRQHGLDVIGPHDWQGGRKWVFRICPFNDAHRNRSAYLLQLPSGAIAAGCHHNGCNGKGWHDLRDLFEPGWKSARRERKRVHIERAQPARIGAAGIAPDIESDSSITLDSLLYTQNPTPPLPVALTDSEGWLPLPDIMAAFERGETGDAELLARLYADRLSYDHAESVWYLWNGYAWERDRHLQAVNFVANAVAAQYLWAAAQKKREVGNGEPPEVVKDLWKRAGSLRYRAKIANVLTLASSQPSLSLTGEEWDSDLWLLGVVNGTLNLKTGKLQPGRPHDYIRNVAPTEWRGLDFPAPRWEQFLQEIFTNDAALIAFLQRLLGYGITGLSREHILAVLWGEGRNGKDTLLETLAHVLGPLASPVNSEVMLDGQRNPNAATPHLYTLRPLRLAWVSETNEGARLDAGRVKLLTGGGTLVARPLYGHPVRFAPQYLLLLVTNYKPHASADDYALWKRLLLIPFTQAFVDNPEGPNEHLRDPHLTDQLKAEAPGILAWLVRGCLAWQREGLNPPEAVRLATEEYQQDEDTVGQFIEEKCVIAPNAEVKAGEVYTAYSGWAGKGNLKPMNQTAFGRRMAKRFKKRTSNGTIYEGVGLRAEGLEGF